MTAASCGTGTRHLRPASSRALPPRGGGVIWHGREPVRLRVRERIRGRSLSGFRVARTRPDRSDRHVSPEHDGAPRLRHDVSVAGHEMADRDGREGHRARAVGAPLRKLAVAERGPARGGKPREIGPRHVVEHVFAQRGDDRGGSSHLEGRGASAGEVRDEKRSDANGRRSVRARHPPDGRCAPSGRVSVSEPASSAVSRRSGRSSSGIRRGTAVGPRTRIARELERQIPPIVRECR